MNLEVQVGVVLSFLLVTTRVLAVLTVAPPFAGAVLPGRVRIAVAVAVALPVAPLQAPDLTLEVAPILTAMVYQVVVGGLFGYVIQLLLSVPLVAGSFVDYLTGFSSAALFDPFANTSATPASRLNQLVTTTILVALDGHLLIIRGVVRSYEVAPLSGLRLDAVAALVGRGAGELLLAALEISLPLVVALLLTEVVLALASKAAPRLNVMVVGFAIKSLVFLLGFALTLPLLINAVAHLVDRAVTWGLGVVGG